MHFNNVIDNFQLTSEVGHGEINNIASQYYGLDLLRSVIPVTDQKGFVWANTKRGLGSINKQNEREN